MSKVGFIGGGSFGTALGILLANKGNEVSIYDRIKVLLMILTSTEKMIGI